MLMRVRIGAVAHNPRPGRVVYVVRMRNIEDVASGDWASFVRQGRRELKLTQETFGARVGVNRSTVWRWEKEGMKPENVTIVSAVARLLGVDDTVALKAAGLFVPAGTAPAAPHPLVNKYSVSSSDPIVRRILAANVDDATREDMFRHYRRRLDELAVDIDWMERHAPKEGEDENGVDSAA